MARFGSNPRNTLSGRAIMYKYTLKCINILLDFFIYI